MNQNKSIIKAENIKLNIENTVLIDGKNNFEINEGQTVLLLGPNGCGKSTLVEQLVGITRSSSKKHPTLNFDKLIYSLDNQTDKNEKSSLENILDKIGYSENEIDSSESNINKQKLIDLVLMFSEPFYDFNKMSKIEFKDLKQKIIGLFELFYGEDYKKMIKQKYGKCSSGQKKKFSIIKALARFDAPLYIFDEPMNCLDTKSMLTFMNYIDSIKKINSKSAFVIITHCLLFDNPDKVYKISNQNIYDDTKNYHKANCLDYLNLN